MTRPKILFLGNGPLADCALAVLEPHFDTIFHAKTREDLDKIPGIKAQNPDAHAILASFGSFVPSKILDLFEPEGILNIHPSKLPEYRGPSPIETAILDGATEFSISVMKLVKEMDAGPLYYQKTLKNLPLDKAQIYQALAEAGATWLVEHLENLPTPVEQQGTPTYTHKFEKSDGRLDPTRDTAEQLYRKIIAFQGFPKPKIALKGKNCTILAAHPQEQGTTAPLEIAALDGAKIAVDFLQPDGKKPMDAKSFLNGYAK